jgi:excisionase family DNA binding protein
MADETPEKLLYSAKELGAALGISRSKIFSMLACGQLPPSIKLGNSRRFSAAVVKRWVELECPCLERFLALTGDKR